MLHFSALGNIEPLAGSCDSVETLACSTWATTWFNGTFGRPNNGMDSMNRDVDGLSEERLLSVLFLGRTGTGVGEEGGEKDETIGTLSSIDDGTDISAAAGGDVGVDGSAPLDPPTCFCCGISCGREGLRAIKLVDNGAWRVSEEDCASPVVSSLALIATGVS